MNVLKYAMVAVMATGATTAMANVITDTVDGVKTVGSTAWDSTKTVAKTVANPGAVSLELGTLGYGASFTWSANDKTEVVAGWNGGNFNADINMQDSYINWSKVLGGSYDDFKGELKLDADMSNPYIGVNTRPWANNFYVGTGVIFQDNNVSARLVPNAATKFTYKGTEYNIPASGEVAIRAESGRSLAPYLSIGFKPSSDKRWGMFGELGAVYSGDWKTSVTVSDNIPNKDKLQQDLENKINDVNASWYPIAKVGATYRF